MELDTETLIAVRMIKSSIPARTIEFFQKSYPFLKVHTQASAKELADVYGASPQAVGKHIHKLVAYQYLTRLHYRAWVLNDEYIKKILGESL